MNTMKLTIKTNIDENGNIIDESPVYKKISQIEAEMMNIDEKTPSSACSSSGNQEDVLNPMPQICAKMEEMRIDVDEKKENMWCKQAPGFEYTGKRTSKGMPDKRTKAGKEWYASVMV